MATSLTKQGTSLASTSQEELKKLSQKEASLYIITQKSTGLKYIGTTTRSVEKRFREHVITSTSTKAKSHLPLYKAMRLSGADDFHVEILDRGPLSSILDKERALIANMNTTELGFNTLVAGYVSNLSAASREKISLKHRGKKYSAETIAKMALANKLNPANRLKANAARALLQRRVVLLKGETSLMFKTVKDALAFLKAKSSAGINLTLNGKQASVFGYRAYYLYDFMELNVCPQL